MTKTECYSCAKAYETTGTGEQVKQVPGVPAVVESVYRHCLEIGAWGHVQAATAAEVYCKEVDLGNEPHKLKNGQKILVADGPLRGDSQTPGKLIRPIVMVAWEKQEVQGDGPAEQPTRSWRCGIYVCGTSICDGSSMQKQTAPLLLPEGSIPRGLPFFRQVGTCSPGCPCCFC